MTPSPTPQTSYVSANLRGRIAIILLVIGAACSALIIVAEIGQIAFWEFSEGQEVADNPGGFAALLSYAALTILGGRYFYRHRDRVPDVAPSFLHQPHLIWPLEIARLFAGVVGRQLFCAHSKSLRALSGHEICLAKKSSGNF